MRARQKVSRAGVELIKSFEGLRATAARLPDGRWTLGYGHTFSAREGATVTQEDADALLRFDLLPIVDSINNLVHVPLNQNQFDALVSFCFNIGAENFAQSTVLKRVNEGRVTEAALAMDAWRSAEFNGQTYVLAPLIRRRAAEKNLFLTPDETATNGAPTLLVRPVEDAGNVQVHPTELNAPDRGGILTTYPVSQDQTRPEPVRPQPSAPSPEMLSPYARPAPATFGQPVSPPAEQVVETLPHGLMPSVVREMPAPDIAPAPLAVEDSEPQMSPQVQAALARAQEEQRLRDEAQRQSEAQALAAEDARLAEQQKLETERQERERTDRERATAAAAAAAAARLEYERLEREHQELERVAVEAARLEVERLERERHERERQEREARQQQEREAREQFEREHLERERAEAARLDLERAEAARLESARLEAERVEAERVERERLDAERLKAEKAEQDKAAALAANQPSDEEAEKIRKAEAAAALMRLYSPYGGGALGRPLTPQKPVAAPVPAPVPAPPAPEFTNHNLITPSQPLSAPTVPPSPPEPVALAQPEPEEPEIMGFTPFKPVVSPSMMPPPVVTALHPYAKPKPVPEPQPTAAPDIVEVPRPQSLDLAATSPSHHFVAPQEVRTPEPSPNLQGAPHWREQLQRPLPSDYRASETVTAPQSDITTPLAAAVTPSLYDDDNEAWTLDGDRIALSSEEMHEESSSFFKMLKQTVWWVFISAMGLGCLGVATAAWWKANQDPSVERMGMQGDFTTLSIIMAAAGIFFVSVSVWLIMKRLGGLKD